MIVCLTGKLLEKTPDTAVVSCGGVGYLAAIPSSTAGALPAAGEECTLYTCMNVTENDVSLYGFADRESQTMFRLLTSVSGVGPRVGLAILSALSPDRIALAAAAGDHKAFTAASGVGPKLAQRIVLELRDKMGQGQGQAETGAATLPAQTPGGVNHTQEAVAALMVLGYSQAEALQAMEGCPAETTETEGIIRYCLKRLAGS